MVKDSATFYGELAKGRRSLYAPMGGQDGEKADLPRERKGLSTAGADPAAPASVTKPLVKRDKTQKTVSSRGGRPKSGLTHAERQKAYRDRRAKGE